MNRKRFVPEFEILEDRNLLSTFFWTGADNNGLWSDPKNWGRHGGVADGLKPFWTRQTVLKCSP